MRNMRRTRGSSMANQTKMSIMGQSQEDRLTSNLLMMKMCSMELKIKNRIKDLHSMFQGTNNLKRNRFTMKIETVIQENNNLQLRASGEKVEDDYLITLIREIVMDRNKGIIRIKMSKFLMMKMCSMD